MPNSNWNSTCCSNLTPLVVLVLSIVQVVVAFISTAVPSTVSVPSISTLSKLDVPFTSISPSKSMLPVKTALLALIGAIAEPILNSNLSSVSLN